MAAAGSSLGSTPLLHWMRALALAGCFSLLLGGHCSSRYDDDDYCDDDCDDDDVVIIITGDEQPDPWSIDDYHLDVDPGTGVRQLSAIAGVSLFDALGPGDRGPQDFAAFAMQVWERNPEHLGPARDGGEGIALHALRSDTERIAVVFCQVGPDGALRLPIAEMEFRFDGLGRLDAVTDATRTRPGVETPAR